MKGAKKGCNGAYSADTLPILLRILERAEGVTESSVEYLYVHETLDNGSVQEVISFDHASKRDAFEEPNKQTSKVINISDHRKKKKQMDVLQGAAALGLYSVYEAPNL
jgi:hypothetical protein